MTRVILICGLPGSGKTDLAYKLKKPSSIVIDDIARIEDLRDALAKNPDEVIVTDPAFCNTQVRELATKKLLGYDIEWIFFENDPVKCKVNVDHRNDGRLVKGLIEALSKTYVIPPSHTPRKIWQPSSA